MSPGGVSSGEGQARLACPCACLVIPRELPLVPRAVGHNGGLRPPPLSPHTPPLCSSLAITMATQAAVFISPHRSARALGWVQLNF